MPLAKNEHTDPIEEDHIVELLGSFQPSPSAHFYRKMRKAPWLKREPFAFIRHPSLIPALAVFALITLLLLGGMAVSPSFRAVAQQIMYFFVPASDDQIDIQVTLSPPDDPNSFGSEEYFSLSLAEVEGLAGIKIKQIVGALSGMLFRGAHYEPSTQTVTLLYEAEGYQLLLIQRPLGRVEEYFSVGASAVVESVEVRGVQGEYVSGGWIIPLSDQPVDSATPGTQVSLDAYWDPELPQYTLRWQENGIAYELRANGAESPQKDALIRIAEGVK